MPRPVAAPEPDAAPAPRRLAELALPRRGIRNYLSYEIGGQELGRPNDVQQALAESFTIIQQHLGTPGQWTPPEELRDQITQVPARVS